MSKDTTVFNITLKSNAIVGMRNRVYTFNRGRNYDRICVIFEMEEGAKGKQIEVELLR